MTASVERFVVTFVRKGGERTLAEARQGRRTYATREEAQEVLDLVFGDPTANNMDLWGEDPRFEVRPVPCYPGHFDPQTCYFPKEA